MPTIFTAPFNEERFDFALPEFWGKIADLSRRLAGNQQMRKMNSGGGSRHFIFFNRTFFGLYNMLHDFRARVNTRNFMQYMKE